MGNSSEPDSSTKGFSGDRYERLQQGAEVLAQDPALAEAAFPFNSEGLPSFIAAITGKRIFDHLSERHADVVTMLLLLDYHQGPCQVAARIQGVLNALDNDRPPTDNVWPVVSGLAAVLALMADVVARLPATDSETI